MTKIPSLETRTFIILLITALASLYGVLIINNYQNGLFLEPSSDLNPAKTDGQLPSLFNSASAKPREVITDTWIEFKDPESNLRFKYPNDWETTTISYTTNNQEYRISIGPKNNPEPISIYTSKKEYFAMDGLPYEKTKINGSNAVTMDKLIYGIKNTGKYFTFYPGQTTELLPEFDALINTINFK